MNILYFLVGCSLLMAIIFLLAFYWALKTGQQDDMVTPGMRMLLDDDVKDSSETAEKNDKNHFSS